MSAPFEPRAGRGAAAPAKVVLARSHVRGVNPWTELASLALDLSGLSPGVFDGIHVAVLALDSLRARFVATRLLLAARVPFVDVGSLAERWLARASVADPAGVRAAEGLRSCPCCVWSSEQLARAGEDVGLPCAAVETGDGFPSTLVMGQRAATLAVRETLALAGVVGVAPSLGCEIRDDLATPRTERFRVAESPECPADHALAAGPVERLAFAPEEIHLAELALELGFRPDDEIVLTATELVAAAACTQCLRALAPFQRVQESSPPCPDCGAATAPLRRARRVRWGDAEPEAGGRTADAWFAPGGDRFAVVSPGGAVRMYGFAPASLDWEPGRAWQGDRARFERLPPDWDLERIRATRLALVGVGHVGSAVLQQLAPLPWGGLLFVDRDHLEPHNLPALAIAAEAAPRAESAP